MKPPPFEYHAAQSLDQALGLLAELRGSEAKVLAGGQSLIPLLNLRLVAPEHVVDINPVQELAYIRAAPAGGLELGALTRQRALERDPEVASRAPLLAEALPLIGDRLTRTRGTIGGSLAHADPAAELPVVAVALDAELVLASQGGRRIVAARDFFVTYLSTVLGPDELLVEVRLPPPTPRAGYAFLELARQHGAFAIVSAAAMVALDNGRIREARLCLGGVGPRPIRPHEAEALLQGEVPGPAVFSEAGRLAAEATEPTSDVHGSAEYRREMAAVYARRALALAAQRAATAP